MCLHSTRMYLQDELEYIKFKVTLLLNAICNSFLNIFPFALLQNTDTEFPDERDIPHSEINVLSYYIILMKIVLSDIFLATISNTFWKKHIVEDRKKSNASAINEESENSYTSILLPTSKPYITLCVLLAICAKILKDATSSDITNNDTKWVHAPDLHNV